METTFLQKKRSSKPVTLTEKIFICVTAAFLIFLWNITPNSVVIERNDNGTIVKLLDENADGIVDKKISFLPNGRHQMDPPTKADQEFFSNQKSIVQN